MTDRVDLTVADGQFLKVTVSFSRGATTDADGDGLGDTPILFDITTACATEVEIDIKPNSDPSSIGCRSKGSIPVAVLGSSTFDATEIDSDTVVFGVTGTKTGEVHQKKGSAKRHVEDYNDDGFADMIFHFDFRTTGFSCADIPSGDNPLP